MARLLSVNVGLPRDIAWRGETVHTAVWKEAVTGRHMVRRLNVDGDGQGDLAGHGGEHRAVMVYQIDSYQYWQKELGRNDFVFGQFGENFTVDGMADDEVSIGDRYRIGSAVFEVTQPRVTCYRVGIRMNEPRMAALLVSHHRPGFYFRVLEEGEVGAGDEIAKLASGPEHMSVAEIDALLYLPGHSRDRLERALRIPALSAGWRMSFEALLRQAESGGAAEGKSGLAPPPGGPPDWPGFRQLRVSGVQRESETVVSLVLEAAEGEPLAPAPPGQFVVLRLRPRADQPPVLRSYSLSGPPSAEHYRISVKQEAAGLASTFLCSQISVGDELETSAPRGSFTLQPGNRPVVLLSAGVGATPVLAMLHALVADRSPREVWWLYGARNREEHPFAEEARELLGALARGRGRVFYSRPRPDDRLGFDFDAAGHLTPGVLQQIGVPRDAEFYLCGPPAFLRDLATGLMASGVDRARVHRETFGSGEASMPGVTGSARPAAHLPAGPPGTGPLVSFSRAGLTVRWSADFHSLLELAEACDVPVRWSCRTGVCHSCETGLVSGEVSYRPDPLDPPARGNALVCCSQPSGDVILDL